MNIKVLVTNVLYDETLEEEYLLDISETTSLQDLFNKVGCMADISEYYECSGIFSFNLIFCPFIITNNNVQYNILFSDVKVSDFLASHNINDYTIHIKTGYVQAGGPGFKFLKEIWDVCEPIFNNIAIVFTLTGVNFKTIWEYIRTHFERNNVSPHVAIDILSTRTQWNHFELAELLDIPDENAKNLLKAFGYEYDNKKMLYLPTKLTSELKEKIKTIQVHSI